MLWISANSDQQKRPPQFESPTLVASWFAQSTFYPPFQTAFPLNLFKILKCGKFSLFRFSNNFFLFSNAIGFTYGAGLLSRERSRRYFCCWKPNFARLPAPVLGRIAFFCFYNFSLFSLNFCGHFSLSVRHFRSSKYPGTACRFLLRSFGASILLGGWGVSSRLFVSRSSFAAGMEFLFC